MVTNEEKQEKLCKLRSLYWDQNSIRMEAANKMSAIRKEIAENLPFSIGDEIEYKGTKGIIVRICPEDDINFIKVKFNPYKKDGELSKAERSAIVNLYKKDETMSNFKLVNKPLEL